MRELKVKKSEENGKTHLELGFKTADQLLDESDPYPLPRKELTEFAEESIIDNLYALRIRNLESLTISLPTEYMTDEIRSHLPETIRRHFNQRLPDLERERKSSWWEERISLILAVLNTLALIFFIIIFLDYAATYQFIITVNILTILVWVVIWRTYEFFVYDIRQMRRKRKIYNKILTMKIQVKEKEAT